MSAAKSVGELVGRSRQWLQSLTPRAKVLLLGSLGVFVCWTAYAIYDDSQRSTAVQRSRWQKINPDDVHVDAYVRDDGTPVIEHMRSHPDASRLNNWSTYPNINPYTGQRGTRRVDGSSTDDAVSGIILDSFSPYRVQDESGMIRRCQWWGGDSYWNTGDVVMVKPPDTLGYAQMVGMSGRSKGKSAKVRVEE